MTTTHLVAPAVHSAATFSLPRAFLLALLFAIMISRATQAADATWVEFAPPTRIDHAAIYDPVRDRMLVFGGRQGCVLSASVMALSRGSLVLRSATISTPIIRPRPRTSPMNRYFSWSFLSASSITLPTRAEFSTSRSLMMASTAPRPAAAPNGFPP